MTTIKLATNDQALIALEQITIASGDINSVEIQVTFDATWDGYGKSAVFFTSNDKTPYEVTLSDDRCTVPHEVLEKTGQLYIGIRGVKYDAVKTSALIKYKIVEGAPRGEGIPVPPASDVYQQLLAAYGDLTARDGRAAVIRVKDSNGGKDVTFWVGTQEQYDAIEAKDMNCVYIVTDDTQFDDLVKRVNDLVTVKHDDLANYTYVRWFSDGHAEAWYETRITGVTAVKSNSGYAMYLSPRFEVPYPQICIETKRDHLPVFCETSLMGAEHLTETKALVLLAGGWSETAMRCYIGSVTEITEAKAIPVVILVHVVWRYKQEAEA